MITIQQAKNLQPGQTIYSTRVTYADGKTPCRFKITSVKTWKRNPQKVQVKVKYGLYQYFSIWHDELSCVALTEEKALREKIAA